MRRFLLAAVLGLAVASCQTAPTPTTSAPPPAPPPSAAPAPQPSAAGTSGQTAPGRTQTTPPAPANAPAQGAGAGGTTQGSGSSAGVPGAAPPPSSAQAQARRFPLIKPGDYRYGIGSGALRYYGLHVPTAYDRTRALPLVIVLHGRGGSAVTAQAFGFNESADHDGFFVVYPEAVAPARMWFTGLEAGTAGADDVAYVRQVLADVTDLVNVDSRRIYAAGYSNGGTLAAHLAGSLPGRIAAFAVVDANIAIRDSQGGVTTVAIPKQPVSALFVHGRTDHASPYAGGSSPVLGGNDALGAREGVDLWAQRMGCAPQPGVFTEGDLEVLRYTGCPGSIVVQLVSFPGSHDWPATLAVDGHDPQRLADYIMSFFFGKGDPGAQ